MNEVFGVLDAIEALILESKRVPFSESIVINERSLLDLVDKVRATLTSDGAVVHQAVEMNKERPSSEKEGVNDPAEALSFDLNEVSLPNEEDQGMTVVQESLEEAERIKEGANEYADYVLANLQLLLTKVQKNLIRLEKNIDSGRDVLQKVRVEDEIPDRSFDKNSAAVTLEPTI